ncbi:hypothetical protein Ahy_B07g086432 [Arachis hypogaea]|uniref:SET domain-containing protein n=1 Tax=Arachis hypogaea TaxID=3818 RepID=A0A444Y9U7_ARAHY|nr:hypothetical protein Ahy_B07g086432 [Arachis hypogaea]
MASPLTTPGRLCAHSSSPLIFIIASLRCAVTSRRLCTQLKAFFIREYPSQEFGKDDDFNGIHWSHFKILEEFSMPSYSSSLTGLGYGTGIGGNEVDSSVDDGIMLQKGKVGVPRQLFVTKNPSTILYEITKAGMKLPLETSQSTRVLIFWSSEGYVDTFLDYDNLSKGIVFTTDRPYQPGEQVFISYGKKSNGELLLSYGFVPREGANPCDSVELSVSLKKSYQSYKEKLELLKKYGLQGD